MLEFVKPKLTDKQWINKYLYGTKRFGCEYTFGNIYMWSAVYKTRIAVISDMFISCTSDEDADVCRFCFPIGDGDLKNAVLELISKTKEQQHSLEFFGLTAEDVIKMEKILPNTFSYEPYRNGFDYIYLCDDLINLSGKKYHSKRNHISAFKKENEWSYEPIDSGNIDECKRMNKIWLEKNRDKNPEAIDNEYLAIKSGFDYYNELGLTGALLRVNGEVIAFTMGERLNDETFCTHFEKAYSEIRGAYPMINREFAFNALSEYKYINREEDTGSEGLRKAKMSYYPEILLEKFRAIYRG